MMIIFTAFFGRVLNVPSDNVDYRVFVFAGLMLWNIFSTGIAGAGNSMVNNANIIKKIYFPRLIIPVSAVLVSLFDFVFTLILFAVLMAYCNVRPIYSRLFLFLPLSLFITTFTTLGLGIFLSALNVKYRDFRYVIPFFIQAMLFVTPVIYPLSMVKHQAIKFILILNPMAAAIDLLRSSITGAAVDFTTVSVGLLVCLTLFATGIITFRKTEAYFADIA
jgi:lipopolysaccharide transport system permease protein